ncbi:MAG: transpeptidase family protein [Spirochaetes bacterium]|nr:transpeptidase family protein [Spirochaetota bacterium]
MDQKLKSEKQRLMMLIMVFALLFFVIIVRLFKLAIIDNIMRKDGGKTLSIYERGEILDVQYKKLALSIKVYSLFCNPQEITHLENDQVNMLSSLLNIDRSRLDEIFSSNKRFVWLKRQIDYKLLKKILNMNIKGIYYLREFKRFYPNGKLCSNVLGITGVDNVGLEGLELYYNKYLSTKIAGGKDEESKKLNLVLSIDKNIQYIVEYELKKVVEKTKANGGIVIIMEPSTGYIVAMAMIPDFNPNYFNKFSQAIRKNRAVSDNFEPGSIFKIFSTAAVYSEKVIRDSDRFMCKGSIMIGESKISCWKKHGELDFHKVIKESCNVGMIRAILRITRYNFYNYLRNFNMGNYTGIDLPGESRGYLRSPKGMGLFSQASVSLGQEVGATAIQIITGACSIYNDGKLMEPKLVRAVIQDDGTIVKKFDPVIIRQAVLPNTARRIREDLKGVVEEGGTGQLAYIRNFPISGKTGTGQIYNKKLKKYDKTKINSSFIGFFPAEKAKYGILVTINQPNTPDKSGGMVAAPLFKSIVEKVISYKGIPNKNILSTPMEKDIFNQSSDSIKVKDLHSLPDLKGKNMREVIQLLKLYKVKMNLIGSGISYKQSPNKGAKIHEGMLISVWFKEP